MDKIVEDFLNKAKAIVEEKANNEKNALLMRNDLRGVIYSLTENDPTKVYPHWDATRQDHYRYEGIANVTPEELEEIKKYDAIIHSVSEEQKSDGIAITLKVFAVLIYIGGVIAAIVASTSFESDFNIGTFFIVLCSSIITGTLFLGFSRIIEYLNKIAER